MISVEEKFLVNILYRLESEILNDIDLDNVNFDKLITLASGHLMLPALFFNIDKKKISYLFPDDFIEYIKFIYTLNKARNTILLAEAKELSELLYENNINHIFLKGTALLMSNVFEDIGERMIGDIDFILQHKDEEKIINFLKKYGYEGKWSINPLRFFKPRHLPRCTNKNKKIAIEPHLELIDSRYRFTLNSKKLMNNFKKEIKTINTPSISSLFDHCIYNFQINDFGFHNLNYSHRSIYDIYKLDCKNCLTIKNIKKDIFIKYFFLTISKFKIFDIQITYSFLNSYLYKCFRIFYIFYSKLLIINNKYFR